ncbi:MAG: glycoside hydrolase family 43 protein [Verrucomicrobiota bacterium]|nr:glycoside hydrolase family 43 protein [Verrucomicrobiota bacterium]
MMKPFLFIWLAAHPLSAAAAGSAAGTFTNPVASGPDPWVIRWKTDYYFCHSSNDGIWVKRAARLQDIGKGSGRLVWRPPEGTACSEELWAPELHRLRGKWYIYVAADDGNNIHHRMVVLEGSSSDPQAPFVLKGKIAAPSDRRAIDGTVLQMPGGKLYFIWSGWAGANNAAQNLYIAPMSNPWTLSGKRVCISRPTYAWECRGAPVNEGPETLWHGGRLFIIYSASGAWGDGYCLGQLTWTGGEVLNPKSWIKKPTPVFSSTDSVFGPGHCSFVKSPDGTEDWIVYHAHKNKGSGWDRNVRIQPFTWNADGSPHFGAPIAPGIVLPEPSGEKP